MTDERIQAAYDKIKIDPNAAVQIWKNILFMQSAFDAMMRKRAEENSAAGGEAQEDGALRPITPAARKTEPVMAAQPNAPTLPDEEEPEEQEPESRFSDPWESGRTEEEPPEEDEEEDVKIYTSHAEHGSADTEQERRHEDTEGAAAERDAGEPEYEDGETEYGGEEAEDFAQEPVRRRARHVKEKKKRPMKLPILLALAALLIAATAGIFLWKRGGAADGNGVQSEGLSGSSNIGIAVVTPEPVAYVGPEASVEKMSNIQNAMQEWNTYKESQFAEYVAANLPSFTEFLKNDDYFDGTDVVENGDETYSCIHWQYVEDWGNTSISPITGQEEPTLIQKFDYEHSVTVEKEEYAAYEAYINAELNAENYGDYNASYGVRNESEAAKLEEIAAKYNLTLRRGEGTSRGFGEASDETLAAELATAVGHGSIYTGTPEIDYFTYFDNGAFQSMAEIRLEDGRRMYTLLCCMPYTEMIDAMSANGITIQESGEMKTRDYTAADGTVLTISQNERQAIIYAYLEENCVVVDMSINSWRNAPSAEDTEEQRAQKQETKLALSEEAVNFVANYINYANIG